MLDIKRKCDIIKEDFIGFYTLEKNKVSNWSGAY